MPGQPVALQLPPFGRVEHYPPHLRVRHTALNGWKSATLPVVHNPNDQPNAPVVFKNFWDFWTARNLSYTKKSWQSVKLVAEGIKDGRVVCTV